MPFHYTKMRMLSYREKELKELLKKSSVGQVVTYTFLKYSQNGSFTFKVRSNSHNERFFEFEHKGKLKQFFNVNAVVECLSKSF